jgi:hypothetical protein
MRESTNNLPLATVFGELIDAWQNRNISHLEHAKMVMRARYFLMAWRTHVNKHPDYSVNIQFISRESYDIRLPHLLQRPSYADGPLAELFP